MVLRGLELLGVKDGMIRVGFCELFRGTIYMSAKREGGREGERGAACSGAHGSQPSECQSS